MLDKYWLRSLPSVALSLSVTVLTAHSTHGEQVQAPSVQQAAPDDPLAPDGPVAREMKRMQEAASFAASQPNPSRPTTIPWFNPKDLDFLDLVHELGRRGVSLQLIVEPPPNCRWYLDILKNESVILRLPVHRDTPLAWTDNTLFWAGLQATVRGYPVAAFDLKTGLKKWEIVTTGLGTAGDKIAGNRAYLEVRDTQLWVVGKEPNGRFAETLDVVTGERLTFLADRHPITPSQLRVPLDREVVTANPHILLKHERVVFDEQAGILLDRSEATLLHSLQMHRGNCSLRLAPDTSRLDEVMAIDFLYGERIAYSIHATPHRVFRTTGDTLFGAVFAPESCGCVVIAVDLESGREIWRTRLNAVGLIPHSAHSNCVNMNLGLEGLEIVGSESHGDYWERLDPATGRTIARRVFRLVPPEFQPPRATP